MDVSPGCTPEKIVRSLTTLRPLERGLPCQRCPKSRLCRGGPESTGRFRVSSGSKGFRVVEGGPRRSVCLDPDRGATRPATRQQSLDGKLHFTQGFPHDGAEISAYHYGYSRESRQWRDDSHRRTPTTEAGVRITGGSSRWGLTKVLATLLFPPCRRRHANRPLKRPAESGFRLVANVAGNYRYLRAAIREHPCRKLNTPLREVLHRGLTDEPGEAFREART